jgi:predicted HNH restriction endonuclease
VDATTDLVPLCANCHRMIHHGMGGRGNCMSVDELKMKYRGVRHNNI